MLAHGVQGILGAAGIQGTMCTGYFSTVVNGHIEASSFRDASPETLGNKLVQEIAYLCQIVDRKQRKTTDWFKLFENLRSQQPTPIPLLIENRYRFGVLANSHLTLNHLTELSPLSQIPFCNWSYTINFDKTTLSFSIDRGSRTFYYDFDSLPQIPVFWDERDIEIHWKRTVFYKLRNFCIVLAPFSLPPYVLLEIFDWLPLMFRYVDHRKKIELIQKISRFIEENNLGK